MLLRRIVPILATVFLHVPFTQGQEYPYIHYTPKDGLVNSRIREMFQDSQGKMYFMTNNGLSIYDGARFTNYTTETGLPDLIVNDVIEITPDSLLVATNTSKLNAWVRGRIVEVDTRNNYSPVINRFLRASNGRIYAATDQGLYVLQGNEFIHFDIPDTVYKKTGLLFDDIQQLGDHLILKGTIDIACPGGLYLFNLRTNKLDTFITQPLHSIVQLRKRNILLAFQFKSILAFDLEAASRGELKPVPVPGFCKPLNGVFSNKARVDADENLWWSEFNSVFRIDPKGNQLILDKTSGLNLNNISNLFVDKEKLLWILTDGSGVIKLANKNLEIVTGLFGKSSSGISALFANERSDTTWLYNFQDHTVYGSFGDKIFRYAIDTAVTAVTIFLQPKGFFLTDDRGIYSAEFIDKKKSTLHVSRKYKDTFNLNYHKAVQDKDGTIFVSGNYLFAWKPTSVEFLFPLPSYSDQIAIDSHDQLWATTRGGDLMCFTINHNEPQRYLTLKYNYKHVIPNLGPRSLVVDSLDNIWVGTRNNGLYRFHFKDDQLVAQNHFTTHDGLTDNFVSFLNLSGRSTVWVGTQSGLDKLQYNDGRFSIQSITRINNVFEFIHSIAVSKDHKIWFLGASGSTMRINDDEEKLPVTFNPRLEIISIKTNDTTVNMPADGYAFSYDQNNISFQAAAPSFIDEKQVLYSYLLEGNVSSKWSNPSSQANFDFINLPPGSYRLHVRAKFPVPEYESKLITYQFSIKPPWWKTLWFKSLAAVIAIALMLFIGRSYVNRRLEKQRIALEKKQAIEKERTRIASDMHDDLGAGLSTIRFLGEKINRSVTHNDKTDIEKIVSNSNDLVQKMNEIIWAMNEKNDSLEDLLFYTRSYAMEYCEENNLLCDVHLPDSLPEIFVSGEIRRNVFLMVKESLHNVVKHAEATRVDISFEMTENLRVSIRDDGKGLQKGNSWKGGNGLLNMKKRMDLLGGAFQTSNGQGFTLTFELPLR